LLPRAPKLLNPALLQGNYSQFWPESKEKSYGVCERNWTDPVVDSAVQMGDQNLCLLAGRR